jgi:hypothetical protein
MTPATLREIIDHQGISQTRFGDLVGVAPRTVRGWLAEDSAIPRSVQALALALDRGIINRTVLCRLIGETE